MLDHQVLLLDTTVVVGIASSITKCCWIPWWSSLVEFSQGIHQVLLLVTTAVVTRGILPGHRAPTVVGGIASSITKCCCW
jgi:hypothetical protein